MDGHGDGGDETEDKSNGVGTSPWLLADLLKDESNTGLSLRVGSWFSNESQRVSEGGGE